MVDLCRGPHVLNTGVLKEAAVGSMTSAFWRGDATKDSLQVPATWSSYVEGGMTSSRRHHRNA